MGTSLTASACGGRIAEGETPSDDAGARDATSIEPQPDLDADTTIELDARLVLRKDAGQTRDAGVIVDASEAPDAFACMACCSSPNGACGNPACSACLMFCGGCIR
jgi:hypothetical protein